MKVTALLALLLACGGAQVATPPEAAPQGSQELLTPQASTDQRPTLWIDMGGLSKLTEKDRESIQISVSQRLAIDAKQYQILPFPRIELLARLRHGRHGQTDQQCEIPPTLNELGRLYDDVDRAYLSKEQLQGEQSLVLTLQMAPGRSTSRPFPILRKWSAPLASDEMPAIGAALAALEDMVLEPVDDSKRGGGGTGNSSIFGHGGLGMGKDPAQLPAVEWSVEDTPVPDGLLACAQSQTMGLNEHGWFAPTSRTFIDLLVDSQSCELRFQNSVSKQGLAMEQCLCEAMDTASLPARELVTVTINGAALGPSAVHMPLPDLRIAGHRIGAGHLSKAGTCLKPDAATAAAMKADRDRLMNATLSSTEMKAAVTDLQSKYPVLRTTLAAQISIDVTGMVTGFVTEDVDPALASCLEIAFVPATTSCPWSGAAYSETVTLHLR